ncbi:MAG: sensor histidine kinase [Phenylobacterium sp.]
MQDRLQGAPGDVPAAALLSALPGWHLRLGPAGRILGVWGAGVDGLAPPGVGGHLADLLPFAPAGAVAGALEMARAFGFARLRAPVERGGPDWVCLEIAPAPGGDLACRITDIRATAGREIDLEAALRESESRSAGKSRFLASLSHELRTPLNAIMGFADAMREEALGPIPARYRGYAELIHESGELLMELISDVLDLSRVEAERFELHPEVFDAREAVTAVVRLMRGQVERAGLTFLAPELRARIEVRADRRALKQMALNLLSNAVKATPPGGRITLSLQVEGCNLLLGVSDTGRGIPPEDLERLGRPFEQAGDPEQKAGGAGLGLSLVKAFAGLHGGELVLTSRPWEGTEAVVRLPVIAAQQARPELDLA